MNTNTNLQELEARLATLNQQANEVKKEIHAAIQQNSPKEDRKVARKQARAEKYKTANGLTIYALRLAGHQVNVTHIRYVEIEGERIRREDGQKVVEKFTTLQPVPSYLRNVYEFFGKGGSTYITITTPSGLTYAVSSHCHFLDSFDYKLGVKKALDVFDQADAFALLNGNAPTEVEVPQLTVI